MTEAEIQEDLRQAVKVLTGGGIIVYPTDTIWGIGCDATNAEAVERLFKKKHRPDSKAMISLVDSLSSLISYVDHIPDSVLREIEISARPLTVIYPSIRGIVPRLKALDGSAAFRIPGNEYTKQLCNLLGRPLVSTSVNISGCKAPTVFSDISEELLELADYVCRFGRHLPSSAPSRIIKVDSKGTLTVIRE